MIAGPANPELFEHMTALADPVRSRILLLLEGDEVTVSDLCTVLQLPQSTVSRQLKTLGDLGWVLSRPSGTKRLYRGALENQPEACHRLWQLARETVEDLPATRQDRERLQSVLAQQSTRTQRFFQDRSAQWDGLREELFGPSFHLFGLMGLVESEWVVAELGCGTGLIAEAVAPFVRRVVGIDASSAMLELAERRLARFDNIELRRGMIEQLPLEDESIDAGVMMLVLHHLDDPAGAVTEAARCLRPGGKLLLVDMLSHDRVEYQRDMGHRWLGFALDDVQGFLGEAGLVLPRVAPLPPAPQAQGPRLFAATARKPGAAR